MPLINSESPGSTNHGYNHGGRREQAQVFSLTTMRVAFTDHEPCWPEAEFMNVQFRFVEVSGHNLESCQI
jgi:hypothetical protein